MLLILTAAVHAQTDQQKNVVSLVLGGKVLLIPAPDGYGEVTAQYESIKTMLASTEPPQNELLAGYVPDSDVSLLKNGKAPVFERYAKISVVRETKERDITRAEFSAVAAFIRGNDKKLLVMDSPESKEVLREFDKSISEQSSKEVKTTPGETTPLGTYNDKPDLFSTMFLGNIKREVDGDVKTYHVLATLNILHVKDRLLSVATYRGYHSEADVEALKTFTTTWVNSILAANK